MAKERDWMDYAQLGLSVAQTAKLSQMAGEMGQVAEETARMRRAAESQVRAIRDAHEAQQLKAQKLKQSRQMIWMAERFLNRLESETDDEIPLQGKYIYAKELEAGLKKAELIPPTALDELEDMDRVGRLETRLEQFQKKLAQSFTKAQREEADLCWQYRVEEEQLDQLIERRTRLEERREFLSQEVSRVENDSPSP